VKSPTPASRIITAWMLLEPIFWNSLGTAGETNMPERNCLLLQAVQLAEG
jgi:hypothetical protein